jgi:hypothetical protein
MVAVSSSIVFSIRSVTSPAVATVLPFQASEWKGVGETVYAKIWENAEN